MGQETMFESISEALADLIEQHEVPEGKISEVVEAVASEGAEGLFKTLKRNAPEMLFDERKRRLDFEGRNYERWKEPLDLLRTLWVCCQEIGEGHAHEGPGDGAAATFEILAHIQPRALLIANEVLCLLEAGYADGALTRWRSLHELVVVAMFLRKYGDGAARSYQLSMWFANMRAANQYNKHAKRAGLTPINSEEIVQIQQACQIAENELGRRLKSDWDWAGPFLGKDRPTFADVEKEVELDHWRPRYKWACQHTHAGFVRPDRLLGMSEARSPLFLVGASNSGLTDPIQMTAISLLQVTTNFLLFPEPNLDRLVFANTLTQFVDEVCDSAVRVQSDAHKVESEDDSS